MKQISFKNLIFYIFFAFLSILIISYLVKYKIALDKLKKIETQNTVLETNIEELKKNIDFAKSPEFVEKIAREKLDMIKDGELIIILQEK